MNPYYNELSFKFDPVSDTSIIFNQKVPQQKIDLEHINPVFVNILDLLGLKIRFIECFKRKAINQSSIHSDHYGENEYVKINWIYGGKNSKMIWYCPKNESSGITQTSSADTPYVLYQPNEVKVVDCLFTKNKPYLIQAGVPHSIMNPEEVRYCVCCLLSLTDGTPVTMKDAQDRLRNYIINGAG